MSTTVSNVPLTPLALLERAAQVWPDKVAITDGERRITYREFAAMTQRLAHALMSRGLGKGDRVAYLMPNIAEMLVGHFGVPLAGGVLVTVNTRLSPGEIAYILSHSAPRFVIVDSRLAALAQASVQLTEPAESRPQVIVTGNIDVTLPAEWLRYVPFTSVAAGELSWSVADENDAISLNYTSGTTGRPKAVVYTHRGAYLNALGEVIHSRLTPQSVYLWTLPMFHCNGWCTPWAVTGIGGSHVCLPEVRGEEIWRLIDTENITHLNAAPTVLTMMMNTGAAHQLDGELCVTTAGAPPSPSTIAQMEALNFRIVHVYGLTETYGPFAICEEQAAWSALPDEQQARRKARQGVPMIQAGRLRVVDDHMRDVPRDGATMGEIVMQGNNVMAGYFNDPDATRAATEGGWFHSGDLAVMHPDGYIEIRDRAKDLVISGGENISSVEVEQTLMSHPGVLEVAVIGVPDEKWGERPKAFVVRRPGCAPSEHELIEHVRAHLAHFKAPREVLIVDGLPKTSTGKVQKAVLRAPEWQGRASLVQG
ncbi:acyl-CoA synthetase [Mycobacterium vulneris]|uniref:Long-chain-fatty-acid--CoA ligase FadD13 n=1 Tax=Mycolicibacterium vulneris TaxID=547163 RepID=A0A1X2KPN7_9MYCO|nr:acyl--CoA ligase family protein [Mycolicibacterium vulneris]OSC23651.1 acyl-CoA synthetase [Mycolicibacterium vulneris]